MTCRPHYGAERAATTPIIKVIVRGVEITSRYRKRRELALMARVISAVPEHEVGNLAAIWWTEMHPLLRRQSASGLAQDPTRALPTGRR